MKRMKRAPWALGYVLIAHACLCTPAVAQTAGARSATAQPASPQPTAAPSSAAPSVVGPLVKTPAPEGELRCEPAAAYLDIRGPASVSGAGPVSLSALPRGRYGWTARGIGIAMARGRFTRDAGGLRFRPFATASALLQPPGMVHLSRSEPRGWYYLGAGAVSGAAWWLSADAARDADNQLGLAQRQLGQASASLDPLERARLQRGVTSARDLRRDERRIRNIWAFYFGTVWVGAGVEAWLMTPAATVAPSGSADYLATFPATTAWRAALLSALVPGAGQRALGRDARANVFSTVIAATLAGAILAQDQVLAARRDYYDAKRTADALPDGADRDDLEAAMDDARSDEDGHRTVRSVMLAVAAPVYLWNLVDAFVGGRRVEAAARSVPGISLTPTAEGVGLALTWRLP